MNHDHDKSGSISYWFTPFRCGEALDQYQRFAVEEWGWTIDEKVRLYDFTITAFGDNQSRDKRIKAFDEIYENLKSYWQVFRGRTAQWDSGHVFTVLTTECMNTRIGQQALNDLAENQGIAEVMDTIAAVKKLKQVKTKRPSLMALSKFLHFFNPTLYPIYDTAVIENLVLHTFSDDWHGFDKRINVPNLHLGLAYYLKYMVWLADLMAKHNAQIMEVFRKWLQEQDRIPRGLLSSEAVDLACRAQALAAEVIAIGAYRAVQSGKK